MEQIAPAVAVVPMPIVNAYVVGHADSWILVDAGTPGNAEKIQQAAAARFGANSRPKAILLTHGHFDHAGSAGDLSRLWNVPVYAHRRERPFLTGKSPYPPTDPTAPGFFSAISRFFPGRTVNLSDHLSDLENATTLSALGFSDWEVIETPGHTPGHVAFFRRSDGVLLAGDAFATVNMDNLLDLLTKKPQVCRPAVPATTNWQQAHASVQTLAQLRPSVIGAGHGSPIAGAAQDLERLASDFPIPEHGRYVSEPARFDDNGITYLPPAPPDYAPGIAASVLLATAGICILRKSGGSKNL